MGRKSTVCVVHSSHLGVATALIGMSRHYCSLTVKWYNVVSEYSDKKHEGAEISCRHTEDR